MKRIINAFIIAFLSLSLMIQFSVTARAEDETDMITSDEKTVFLMSGEQHQLTYQLEPADSSAGIDWSNITMINDCCSLDDSGLVKAEKSGRALIWASLDPNTRVDIQYL